MSLLQSVLMELVSGGYPAPLRVKAIEAHARRFAETPELRHQLAHLLRDDDDLVRTAAFAELAARGWQPEQGTLALAAEKGGALSLSEGSSTAAPGEGGELSLSEVPPRVVRPGQESVT